MFRDRCFLSEKDQSPENKANLKRLKVADVNKALDELVAHAGKPGVRP